MAKAKNKTVETQDSVAGYLATVADDKKRSDTSAIIELIAEKTGLEPKMWGTSIVGFGLYNYKYESGREGNAPLVGLSARANAISLYIANFENRDELLAKFGKHKTGKGCIYIQRLEDVDTGILVKMAKKSIEHCRSKYPD
jgi:hypothetical protein